MPAFLFCLCAAWGREGLVQPDRPGDPAFILPHGAGGPGLAEEPGLPRGRLERRLLTAAGRTYPCHTHSSSLCQVCVFSVHPCLIFKSEGSSSLRLEGLLWALSRSSSWPRALKTDLVLFMCSVSLRVFSLNVPLASKTLVILIYKPSAGITVSLELKTTDASLCTHINARDVNREFLTIHPLLIPAYPLQRCCGGLEPIPAWVLLLLLHVR